MKYLKWIGAAFVFVIGMMFASNARRNKQRAEALTEREIAELAKGKQANLKKADKLGKQAKAKFDTARDRKATADAVVEELEKKDATPLADRMRRFNDGL